MWQRAPRQIRSRSIIVTIWALEYAADDSNGAWRHASIRRQPAGRQNAR